MRTRSLLFLAGLVAVFTAAACTSMPAEVAMQGTSEDETAIRGIADKYVAAFNANDAAGIAALVSNDYMAVAPDGTMVSGKDAFQQAQMHDIQMRQKMNVNLKLTASTSFVHWLDANNASIGGPWMVEGAPEGTPAKGSWMGVVHKSEGGEWMMTNGLVADYVQPPADSKQAS